MTPALRIAKALLPAPVGRSLRRHHRALVFRRAMRRFMTHPEAAVAPGSDLLSALIYGWGNESWSAREEYLAACLQHALTCKGPILECGSGLTTLLVGAIAQRSGNTVWSLEHHAGWRARVRAFLKEYAIGAAEVCHAPLSNYGDFCWYSAPLEALPHKFSLVICDGPPADTPGGRYGLVPVMAERLQPGTVVLLDDAARTHERTIANRWAQELDRQYELLGVEKPYARFAI
jgi:Methyltransferase domain